MGCNELNIVWLQGGGCTGCSVSLLNAGRPTARELLVDELLPGSHLSFRYHPTLMAAQGEAAVELLENTPEEGFVLALEGSLPENPGFCTVGDRDGHEKTVIDAFLDLAPAADLVMAVGTCACFGGIPSGAPNPGRYCGAGDIMLAHDVDTPLINVPGCPPHPDWVSSTLLAYLAAADPSDIPVDALKRPLAIYGEAIHENCPRRAYYDEGKFAEKPGDPGCLHKVGCKGPITYADCPLREWNNHVNWCIKAGAPCQGCTQPEFIDLVTPIYRELDEDAFPRIGEEPPREDG